MSVPPSTGLRRAAWLLIVIGAFALPVLSLSSPPVEHWLEALPLATGERPGAAAPSASEPRIPAEPAGAGSASTEARYWLLRVTCREDAGERQYLTARVASPGQPIEALLRETEKMLRLHLAGSEPIEVSVAEGPLPDPPLIADRDRIPMGWE